MKISVRSFYSTLGLWIAVLMSVSSVVQAASNGASSGGGADGLYLNLMNGGSAPLVIVPVPEDLLQPPKEHGTLLIKGVPGEGQSTTFSYSWCPNTGPDQNKRCFRSSGELNQPVKVPVGVLFQVSYSNTFLSSSIAMPVEIRKDAELSFELKQIEVPKVDSNFKFEVYADLSDANMNRQYAFEVLQSIPEFNIDPQSWGRSATIESPSGKRLEPYNAGGQGTLLEAIASGDVPSDPELSDFAKNYQKHYDAVEKGIYSLAGPNGGYRFPFFGHCEMRKHASLFGSTKLVVTYCSAPVNETEHFTMISDPKDGQTVSVFPGVYGLKFTAPNGQVSYVHGIRVE